MPSRDHKTDRRSTVRGLQVLRFDTLETRQLLSATDITSVSPTVTAVIGTEATATPAGVSTPVAATSIASISTAAVTALTSPVTTVPAPTVSSSTSSVIVASPVATSSTPLATLAPASVSTSSTTTSSASAPIVQPSASSSDLPPPAPIVVAPVTAPSPTISTGLVPFKLSVPGNLAWGQTFQVTGMVRNNNPVATQTPAQVFIFASPTSTTGSSSVSLGSVTVPAGLAPGAIYNFSATLQAPQNPTTSLVTGPSYYVTTTVGSPSATNYGQGLLGVDSALVGITAPLSSHLVAVGLAVTPSFTDWGQSVNVTATINNQGPGDAPATNARIILAPYGQDPFGPNGYTIGAVPIPQIPANQTVSASQDIRLPYAPPAALANVSKFTMVMVSDAQGLANPVATPMNYQGNGIDWTTLNLSSKPAATPLSQLPELAATALTTPTAMSWGQTVQLKLHVMNVGAGNAGQFTVGFSMVQSDSAGAPVLTLGDATVAGLQAGHEQDISLTVKLPAQAPSGMLANAPNGRIIATIDPAHVLDEVRTPVRDSIESPPITLRLVAQNGTTTPVVTSSTPAPTTTGTTAVSASSSPPGAVTTPTPVASIPITTPVNQSRIIKQVVKRNGASTQHQQATHLKVYPTKHHAVVVSSKQHQIKVLSAKLAQLRKSGPNLPA